MHDVTLPFDASSGGYEVVVNLEDGITGDAAERAESFTVEGQRPTRGDAGRVERGSQAATMTVTVVATFTARHRELGRAPRSGRSRR